jgi:AcrR family transcriptional regulator
MAATRVATRERILDAARELFSRQGYSGTGLKAILAASNAPFGSLYHFFPNGKEELAVEAIRLGGITYRELVESVYTEGGDVIAATAYLFEEAALIVEGSGYADACPVATIALEVASTSEPLREAAAAAFDSWLGVARRRFEEVGITAARAEELAIELFCAIEGAFLLARTARDGRAIRLMGRVATRAVAEAVAEAVARGPLVTPTELSAVRPATR